MTLTELYSYIGELCNDPNHDRYTTDDIDTELDNSQDKWNVRARILRQTDTITVVDGTRQYAISTLDATPMSWERATHKGIDLKKKDVSFFDLYTGHDWTQDSGTPVYYYITPLLSGNHYVNLYPTPTGNDAGANLVVEYIYRHTPMSTGTDQPFNAESATIPYHYGLGNDAASRLLMRDPNPENVQKSKNYMAIADGVLSDVVQTLIAQGKEEPYRIRIPGVNWSRRWSY